MDEKKENPIKKDEVVNQYHMFNPEPLKPTRIMVKLIMVAALIIIIIGLLVYRSLAVIPFIFGVLITSGLNIMKIRMLEKTVQKVIYMENQNTGKNIVRFQYLLRYFLTGIVLVVIGLIHNYTTPSHPLLSNREHLAVWAILFPNAPESLLSAPFISIWGALAGIFTLQIAVIIIRFFKLEKDGTEFIEYKDDDEESNEQNDEEITTCGDENDEITDETTDDEEVNDSNVDY